MKYSTKFISLIILSWFLLSCNTEKDLFVPFSDTGIVYSGRVDKSPEDKVMLYWSGTSVKINFTGSSIEALLKDEEGENYFNVLIDNDSARLLHPDTSKSYFLLASDLDEGEHSLEIFKRTEWTRGSTGFYGFRIKGRSKILPPPEPAKRKIEFYGNSITAGYAIEDSSGNDSPDSTFTNNYLSYAAITARHFNAEYSCIARGGIGISISWFPMIMPEMFDLLNPMDKSRKWDFSLFTPDIVVINLFQNDSWLVNRPQMEVFKERFGETAPDENFIISAYADFVREIRTKYPDATILCILGNMDITTKGSVWPEYVKKAVKSLEDEKILTHFIPYKETPGHPRIEEHEIMAESLITFIEENINW